MKLNKDKCHLLVAEHRYETLSTNIGETWIWESKNEKLLRLTIDRNLNFDDHVFTLCKEAGSKLSALSRISNYMIFFRKENYFKIICGITVWICPLSWMFHSRNAYSKINDSHERTLRRVHKDNISSYEELPKKDKIFSINHRNIQPLTIERFKLKSNLSNRTMCDIFQILNN